MPLLISSRMMSAGLTPSSSASSLTVIVPGSSIAPRSRGSRTCTPAGLNVPSRRGGLRGPRRPRVPLLLLATRSSFSVSHVRGGALDERRSNVGRELGSECPAQGTLGDGFGQAGVDAAHVGAATGQSPGRIDGHRPVGRADKPQEVPLRPNGATGNAGPARDAPGSDGRCHPAYDATPSDGVAAFRLARFALATGAAASPAGGAG